MSKVCFACDAAHRFHLGQPHRPKHTCPPWQEQALAALEEALRRVEEIPAFERPGVPQGSYLLELCIREVVSEHSRNSKGFNADPSLAAFLKAAAISEAQASVDLDNDPRFGTHFVGDDCEGGHDS